MKIYNTAGDIARNCCMNFYWIIARISCWMIKVDWWRTGGVIFIERTLTWKFPVIRVMSRCNVRLTQSSRHFATTYAMNISRAIAVSYETDYGTTSHFIQSNNFSSIHLHFTFFLRFHRKFFRRLLLGQ